MNHRRTALSGASAHSGSSSRYGEAAEALWRNIRAAAESGPPKSEARRAAAHAIVKATGDRPGMHDAVERCAARDEQPHHPNPKP